ncbi:hypothetical protein VHUM_01262 [Vanrija humicola]|uniref:Trafficking protein particle complex subunit n=1 Tax=Vanrija humicola TaxID=5417 RepID=A0A7D8V7J3_VANHU|nr:hypothetical protein VHUM_01262 [Vanrija humicola]
MSRPPSSSTTPHAPIAPIAPAAVHQLASPVPALVDAALPAYLVPSALKALTESASYAVHRRLEAEREAEGSAEGAFATEAAAAAKGKGKSVAADTVPGIVEEAVATRMERIGFMVGGFVAENAPIASHLDIIKFICKDLFLHVYGKQIDNLRTNHRGVFVLQSHAFPPLAGLSSYRGAAADLEAARVHLVFPQALIQGALARLGMVATVTAESAQLPQCTFQIRTVKHSGGASQQQPPLSAGVPPTPTRQSLGGA